MHIFPAMMIGMLVWIGAMAMAATTMYAVIAGPVIVSGVALVLALAPEFTRARPWHSSATMVYGLSLVVFVGALISL